MSATLPRLLPSIPLRAAPDPRLGGAAFLGRDGGPLDSAPNDSLVVGTLRMGYGHYRMGRAAVTWGLRAGARVFVHDPLSIDSVEASVMRISERAYSACSRLSATLGGPAERAWGRLMKCGGPQSRDASRRLARGLERLMAGVPRDWPIICTHPWSAHLAVVGGLKRVVHLIPDSDPQHFFVVPETLSLTQNEESRRAMIALGAPPERVATAGHWVPAELAENAEADSGARLRRLGRGAPLRLLFSIGGAGAQSEYLEDLFSRLAASARGARLRLVLNVGDHPGLAQRFERALRAAGLAAARVDGETALDDFIARHALEGPEIETEAVIVAAAGTLEAVAATDRLIRVCDVLVTKPSELAFFPLPKLHIRRVGDHEAAGARYSAELGDGTPERRDPAEAAADVGLWLKEPGALARLNDGVLGAARRGIYLGAKVAVARALERDFS